MAAPPRKRNRAGEMKREEIRRAAYECFRAGGFHATAVDDICAAAGASKGSFYWHYASKQEVFVDILETWTREIMDQLYEQFEEAVIDADYVVAITEALKREVKRGRVIIPLWLEFIAQGSREPELQGAVAKFHRRARAAIAAILRPAVAERISEPELQAIAATIFGAYLGLVVQDGADPERARAVENVQVFMSLLGRIFQYLPQVEPDAPVQ
ncbi:MAG: TetR/AcrR family transcriptional regulator [bacterium]